MIDTHAVDVPNTPGDEIGYPTSIASAGYITPLPSFIFFFSFHKPFTNLEGNCLMSWTHDQV
jgi:hypothetical protein